MKTLCLFHACYIHSAKTVQTKFDASTLHSNRALAAQTQMVDDGTGKCEVCWDRCGRDVRYAGIGVGILCEVCWDRCGHSL